MWPDIADAKTYWIARIVFQRGLGLTCLVAFLCALNQFRPLVGERGLLPVPIFVRQVPFKESPSLFYWFPKDAAFTAAAWIGIVLSCLVLTGITERFGSWLVMIVWAAIYLLYLSFVNVGQTFYSFGWESILLEACFFSIFMGSNKTTPQQIPMWLMRWLLFRVMFGAGLIKLRGDPCWRNLTCLDWHFETQPMPNPLSWYYHWMPEWGHKAGVLFNHFSELIVPFGYFLPQPVATIAGLITIAFQLFIMSSGNLSWLNFLTIILAIPTLDDRFLHYLVPLKVPALTHPMRGEVFVQIGIAVLVVLLSIPVVTNMFSTRQIMNFNFNPLHLVGTYGAFGSVTRPRYEVVVQGTDDNIVSAATKWRDYEFKGKPGDPKRLPPQVAPYHMRLDWLMWFAAMSSYDNYPWFVNFVAKLLEGDKPVLSLLRKNPFPDKPPRYIRALLFEYHFTTPDERRKTGAWWKTTPVGSYFPTVSLDSPAFRRVLEQQGWL